MNSAQFCIRNMHSRFLLLYLNSGQFPVWNQHQQQKKQLFNVIERTQFVLENIYHKVAMVKIHRSLIRREPPNLMIKSTAFFLPDDMLYHWVP